MRKTECFSHLVELTTIEGKQAHRYECSPGLKGFVGDKCILRPDGDYQEALSSLVDFNFEIIDNNVAIGTLTVIGDTTISTVVPTDEELRVAIGWPEVLAGEETRQIIAYGNVNTLGLGETPKVRIEKTYHLNRGAKSILRLRSQPMEILARVNEGLPYWFFMVGFVLDDTTGTAYPRLIDCHQDTTGDVYGLLDNQRAVQIGCGQIHVAADQCGEDGPHVAYRTLADAPNIKYDQNGRPVDVSRDSDLDESFAKLFAMLTGEDPRLSLHRGL